MSDRVYTVTSLWDHVKHFHVLPTPFNKVDAASRSATKHTALQEKERELVGGRQHWQWHESFIQSVYLKVGHELTKGISSNWKQ